MDMDHKMIFVIGPPRSGSTLLQRMLSSHSQIFSCPEPHILTPLAHLGYYENVDQAPYDHLRAVDAIRGFVDMLPNKEQDYIDACRAYADTLYSRRMNQSSAKYFLDKTPAYGLILDFITKIYPDAKYIVLTRHPAAIFSSYAKSFFDDDYEAAQNYNPILNRYLPAMARFIREKKVPFIHVRYEDVVKNPPEQLQKIFEYLQLEYQEEVIHYGNKQHDEKGLGDPYGVKQHNKPVTSSVSKWAREMAGDQNKIKIISNIVDSLEPQDVKTWGYDYDSLLLPLKDADPDSVRKKRNPINKFTVERKVLRMLRKNIHQNRFGKIVKKVRFTCDVLLR